MANPNYNDILSSTLKDRSSAIRDNVLNSNKLLSALLAGGSVEVLDGGEAIVRPISFAENGTFGFFSGFDTLDITPSNTLTSVEYDWKNANVSIRLSGEDMRKNAGTNRILNLLKQKIDNAETTMANNLSTSVYSDGTGSSGKELGGLALLVADAPATGTVGGIDRAADAFWRNQVTNVAGITSSNIVAAMDDLWLKCQRGLDVPKLIVCGATIFQAYKDSFAGQQRFTGNNVTGAGFEGLKYSNDGGTAPVMFDPACPTKHMYMLNTDFLGLSVHSAANFTVQDQETPIDQDSIVQNMLFMGNLTMTNAARQGVIVDTV